MPKGSRSILCRAKQAKHGVKQAAPEKAARDVLPHHSIPRLFIRVTADEPNTRRNVPGSRLFKEICGHPSAETNIVRSFRYDPKRLPSSDCAPRLH